MSNPRARQLAAMIELNRDLMSKLIGGVGDEEWFKAPIPGRAHLAWLLGHNAYAFNNAILNFTLNLPFVVPADWVRVFGPDFRGGQGPIPDATLFPSVGDIIEGYQRSANAVAEATRALTDDELDGPGRGESPANWALTERSIADAVMYLNQHDAYHRGQMAWLLKAMRDS